MANPTRTQRIAEISLIGVTIAWGATFTLVKSALNDASTLLFLALRFILATVALAAAFRIRGLLSSACRPAAAGPGAVAGLCLFVAYFFQTLGLRYTTAAKSAFLTSLCAVLVPLLAMLVYKAMPRPAELFGVAVAMAGMALMTLPSAQLAFSRGDLLTLICAFAFAAHILAVGRFSSTLGFEGLSLAQLAVVAVLASASFSWAESPRVRWTPLLLAAVGVTGILCTAIAFTVQAWAQQHTTANRTALIFALEPVSALATSYLVEGELLSARSGFGALMILAGVLAVELKPERSP